MSLPDQNNPKQTIYAGRLAIQQRVLPEYRVPFFDTLAERCESGLSIFAGKPKSNEHVKSAQVLQKANFVGCRNINFLSITSKYYLCWQIGLINWLEDWRPDGLILEANPRFISSPRAVRWMRVRNRPVLGWGLGVPDSENSSGWRKDFRTRFLFSLDAIISYSQQGAQEYKSLGIPPERVFVATNAIVRPPVSPPEKSTDEFVGRAKVLFVGRLQSRKRLDLLINACAKLPEEIQPLLWIVGDGPSMSEIKNLASRIYSNTQFFGSLYGNELDDIFRRADLFVLPGTGGLAVQQAMSYGLPIIMAEGDGTQSDLIVPENGWQIIPGDEKNLLETLTDALSHRHKLRQMGLVSYYRALNLANIDRMADTFVEALVYANNQVGDKRP